MTGVPFFSDEENARRKRRVLTEPLRLGKGEGIADLDLIVAADFRNTPATHAITAHPSGVKIRNVRILFETDVWQPYWGRPYHDQPKNAIPSGCSGLNLAGTTGVDIDGLHIEGAPRFGIEGWDVAGMNLRRYSATRCGVGAHFAERAGGNQSWQVDQVRVWDTWGPPGGYPSRVRPGGWVGGDCWVSEGDRISLNRMEFSGEMFVGAKICRGSIVTLTDITTPTLMFQGSSTPTPGEPGLVQLKVRGLYLNAATGYGDGADTANKLQISWTVMAQLDGGYLIGNGKDGNAVQVTGGCHVEMRGFTIGGFNGERGKGNPAHALELDVRDPVSTINEDFETANRFPNQQRILRRAA